jgi:hypothetical protein
MTTKVSTSAMYYFFANVASSPQHAKRAHFIFCFKTNMPPKGDKSEPKTVDPKPDTKTEIKPKASSTANSKIIGFKYDTYKISTQVSIPTD